MLAAAAPAFVAWVSSFGEEGAGGGLSAGPGAFAFSAAGLGPLPLEDCFWWCGARDGPCHGFCGAGRACCAASDAPADSCPAEVLCTEGMHCCVNELSEPPPPPLPPLSPPPSPPPPPLISSL
mmetsp:Transcript_43082/g.143470  ORF Transcript_43082/g.143470 Transcript_43082/m.143470 type:complete len:123 (-) Transcript_43082:587-955(-)